MKSLLAAALSVTAVVMAWSAYSASVSVQQPPGTASVAGYPVNLGTDVTGSLPIKNLNGGQGATAATFWRGDGTWAAPPTGSGSAGGTVTSVSLSAPTWLAVGGSPVTTSGTLSLAGASEPKNLFLASPSGAAGALAPRAIAPSDLPVASNSSLGAATCDGITITCSSGVFTAVYPGITQLIGPVTTSSGGGTQVTTIAPTGVAPGSYANATITVGADGRISAVSSGRGGAGGSVMGQITGML